MNSALGSTEVQLFQAAIAQRLGLHFDDGKLTFLAEVLTRRVEACKQSPSAYLGALASELEAADELSELARELTVGETYFFRHSEQFDALCEVALPERAAARAQTRQLRLLSAGCASGEEAYTLAILVRERGIDPAYKVQIQGLDLNPDALKKARGGVYSAWSLRDTSEQVRRRWFVSEGKESRVSEVLREAVRFDQHNLILPGGAFLLPESYDVIFCRNVLMYFTPDHAAAIVGQLTRALVPGGFLFLGHAETLRGLSHAFHLRHTHNTFYYQRKNLLESTRPLQLLAERAQLIPEPAPNGEWTSSWLEAVERSSARIRALTEAQLPAHLPLHPAQSAVAAPRSGLSQPLELLRNERFADALLVMDQLGEQELADPATLLLRAALLTHQGELALAEKTCRDLLRLDDLNAGAHYLIALCFERAGQLEAAIEQDLTAVYLDAGFAMPHLHLGLMARRRRDVEAARRELSQALSLLELEDESRLVLFGGGFTRGSLLTLCRSELENLRGAS